MQCDETDLSNGLRLPAHTVPLAQQATFGPRRREIECCVHNRDKDRGDYSTFNNSQKNNPLIERPVPLVQQARVASYTMHCRGKSQEDMIRYLQNSACLMVYDFLPVRFPSANVH